MYSVGEPLLVLLIESVQCCFYLSEVLTFGYFTSRGSTVFITAVDARKFFCLTLITLGNVLLECLHFFSLTNLDLRSRYPAL